MSEKSGEGWAGHVAGLCPVQGEGVVDGAAWYFRARGSRWEFEVCENPDADKRDPADPSWEVAWSTGGAWGEWPEAGDMPDAEAWRLIEGAIAAYRRRPS